MNRLAVRRKSQPAADDQKWARPKATGAAASTMPSTPAAGMRMRRNSFTERSAMSSSM
jgi:hypothetical protein